MGFFRRLFLGEIAPREGQDHVPVEAVWQPVAHLSLAELTQHWEAQAASEPTLVTFLAVLARAYELALADPSTPRADREPAQAFALRISAFQGPPPYPSVNVEHEDTFRDFIKTMHNTGDLDR